MKRRDLLVGAASVFAMQFLPWNLRSQHLNTNLIKPKALQKGDLVGVVAPGTNVPDPDDIQKAKQVLDYFGLKYRFGKNLLNGSGYKSRSVDERVEDLHSMFSDKEVKAIFCIRGGYGSIQLLNNIDYNLIRKNPKIFVGYSDITVLHLAINKFAGLVTFHGPVLLSRFTSYTVDLFKKVLFINEAAGIISNPEMISGIRPAYPNRTICSGIAKGKLTGGNLSLISSIMGTKYEIDTNGKILFLEDIGENAYRIDRMLSQLKLAGKLQEAKGIIFGKCMNCDADTATWDASLGQVLDYQLGDLNIPVFYGLLIGHTSDQSTLPYGIDSRIDADLGTIEITEPSVL
jgi:muramoyltetrapeptide carboxypeptidase